MNIKRGYSWRKIMFAPYFPVSTIFMYSKHPDKFQENFSEVQTARMVTETFHRIHNKDGIFVELYA